MLSRKAAAKTDVTGICSLLFFSTDENPVGSPYEAISTDRANIFWRNLVLSSITQAQKVAAHSGNAVME
jgi:hypothetical protein